MIATEMSKIPAHLDDSDVEYYRVEDNLSVVMVFRKVELCRECSSDKFVFIITPKAARCLDCYRKGEINEVRVW